MSSSSLSSKSCFNLECPQVKPERLRPGWRLRTGDFADLCDRCASAYEEGRFCEIYHSKASGWRFCESCGKRIHCGCIVSAYAFMLLDAGGIECLACARKNVALVKGPNFSGPPSFFFQPPIAEKLKDFSVKSWSHSAGLGRTTCLRAPDLSSPVLQSDLHNRDAPHEAGQSTSGDRATVPSMEKREIDDCPGKLMSGSLKLRTSVIIENGNAGNNCDEYPGTSVNVYQLSDSLKEDPSGTQLTFPVPFTTPNEINGRVRLAGTHLPKATQSPRVNHLHYDLNNGADLRCENESRNMRPQVDSRGKHQMLPRYWPRFTDQDLQNLSTDSNSIITPLFEKMLSASDAGRIGRLVLPKKCAEAYLPQISQPEGLPLKVQDSMGKEWVFQFRFWPNNNSRMYVLEGVTPCIQNMQLQAGDTVTFSRLDPEGKLIMGFRKASVAQSSDQENGSTKNSSGIYTNGDAEPADPHPLSKADKSAYIAKEALAVKSSSRKRKSSRASLKSKRLKVENKDLMELKLTWEEAQGLLQPPPNNAPTIIVIEGFEFEEYEDAPIIGKPTVFATDDKGSSCSAARELGTVQPVNMLSPPNSACPKMLKAAKQEAQDMVAMEELDTLGKLGILGVNGEGLSMSSKATTKHPRHRLGCTCIVCIQPPSGKGPKHEQSCTCTVCQTVKRRFRTLMLRREKKQTEKEGTTRKKDQQLLSSDEELHQCDNTSVNSSLNHKPEEDQIQSKSMSASPFKGQIDLNIQPERDEESPRGSDSTAVRRMLPRDVTEETCFEQPRLSSGCSHSVSVINQINPEEGGKPTTNIGVEGGNFPPVPLTAETYAPP